jgi:hypothetical protein
VLDITGVFPGHHRSIAYDASQQFLRGGFEPIPAAALDNRPGQLLRNSARMSLNPVALRPGEALFP